MRLLIIFIFILSMIFSGCSGTGSDDVKTKGIPALAVLGDKHHDFEMLKSSLKKILEEKTRLKMTYTNNVSYLTAENMSQFKLIVFSRTRSPILTEDTTMQNALMSYVRNGGSALFLHNSSHLSKAGKGIRHLIGGFYRPHGPLGEYKVEITDKNHPITQGVNDFELTGEQHYPIYDKDQKYVFMRNVNLKGESWKDYGPTCEAGWAYDYGEGRVCFMSPGHDERAILHPEYMKLIVNATKWLLKEE